MDVWVYSGNEWLIRDPAAPHVEREAMDGQVRADGRRGFRPSTGQRAVKIVGVSDDHDLVRALRERR